tara:strand:+ start:139 stop:603 length:465 start_codon:yes stop_codon:yes gene_type:complete
MSEENKKTTNNGTGKIGIVLVRGLVGVREDIKLTLKLLRLDRVNQAVVIENNVINQGMLKKIKDYVTWGMITDETYSSLVEARGEEFLGRTEDSKKKYSYKGFFDFNGKKYKKVFRLNPPRKGFGRKGIKRPFKTGGALGNRQGKINELIKSMI